MAGRSQAREGLRRVHFAEHVTRMNEGRATEELAGWREVQRKYRMEMYLDGEESVRDEVKRRKGIAKRRVEKVLKTGGRLSEGEALLCRTRYFLDGLVIGSESFVNGVFGMARGYFGPKRESGARQMRGVETGLCTIRDLQKDAVVP